jgi:signal transduction histidine kinase
VAVSVTDSGPGIKPEHLNRVFEPLFSTRTVGIGLGLSVCQALVEANQGTIEVQSEPGKGATFTFSLPVAETADGRDPENGAASKRNRKSVESVDENPENGTADER